MADEDLQDELADPRPADHRARVAQAARKVLMTHAEALDRLGR